MNTVDRRMIAGLCRACGAKKEADGHTLCPECLKKRRIESRERRRKLSQEGLCYECGRAPCAAGKRRCADCIEKAALRQIRYSMKRGKVAREHEQLEILEGEK